MSDRWRLLIFSEPGKDGVFVCVRSLIRYIHAHHPEIQVDMMYSSLRSGAALPELVKEVQAHGGQAIDVKTGNAPRPADFKVFKKLLEYVWSSQPKIIHAHSSKAGALARLAAVIPGFPPVIYSPHAYYGMPCAGGAREGFYNILETILGQVGTTLNCSEDERDFAQKKLHLPARSLVVIHHGIDTRVYSPAAPEEKKALRRQLGIPVDGKLLVTVGRDSPQKNYAPLYAVLDKILPGSNWMFGHAGAGSIELRSSLREAAQSKVHAYSHLEDPSILLRASDGFILTSRYEGLSLSMLHALSCGLSMIQTEAPGLRVLKGLGFSEVLWLPDPATGPIESALDSTLRAWADSPSEVLTQQRARACEYFTENRQLEKIIELYQERKLP